ncbi:hypothetical protein D3C87_1614440 [compost metagenome]
MSEAQWGDNAQMSRHNTAPACQFISQIAKLSANLPRAHRQQSAFVGECGAPPGTIHEPDAQALFQCMQPLRDGGGRHVQGARRLRERRGGGQAQEKSQVVARDHLV